MTAIPVYIVSADDASLVGGYDMNTQTAMVKSQSFDHLLVDNLAFKIIEYKNSRGKNKTQRRKTRENVAQLLFVQR